MSVTLRIVALRAGAAGLLTFAAACSSAPDYAVSPMRALAGFEEIHPLVAELTANAAAVAVFVGVEGTAEGCAHTGALVLPGGEQREVVLRCLEEPPAPGGYSYHQLVVLRDPAHVEELRTGPLDLADFVRLAPHEDHPPEGHEHAPGWIVSTHRPQLLFGDPTVRQRLEPGT